ncbi:MAG: cyclic pyranopterin monophosphate synthase MoaC [Lachnospiraceae bacterium]|nr:cyclic pyranopterin monophosphate synthase MoaC [Lachnospiraceae bacterium]
MEKLTHIDSRGHAVMVDVSDKEETTRTARAGGTISMSREALSAVIGGNAPKGDVLCTARIAGIMAAKKTSELIPLCHTLMLTKVSIDFEAFEEQSLISAYCTVKLKGRTGAEMEALTGVSTALLTIYDMLKAIDRSMVISDIRLLEKDGGKTGHYIKEDPVDASPGKKKEISVLL